jgi:hypothetical protein
LPLTFGQFWRRDSSGVVEMAGRRELLKGGPDAVFGSFWMMHQNMPDDLSLLFNLCGFGVP